MSSKNVVPALPNGVRVGDKPSDLEVCCMRNADRWRSILETLKIIDNVKTVQIDILPEMTKSKIMSMKQSLILYAKRAGFKHKIKFAMKDSVLHIWCNKS